MRNKAINVDRYGIDPLKDKVSENLHKISLNSNHIITSPDVGNIDTLAYRYYGKASLGFILLDYNGLGHEMQMITGETLLVPDKGSVLALFNQKTEPKAIGTTNRISI